MAIFSWDGTGNLDLKQQGESFDFRTDVLQISDPDLQASQFDVVEAGTDLAIILSRAADGTPLDAADIRYLYIPNMVVRQIGTDAGGSSHNIVMSNGGQLWVGDRATDTLDDDGANAIDLSQTSAAAQVWGLGGADTISTGLGDDRVYGNISADVISGGAGHDSLYGGQDGDDVSGGAGDDNVAGDLGDDNLDGGAGDDILYGGAGADTIETGIGDDTVFAGAGDDVLALNDSATGDKLVYMDRGQDMVLFTSTTGDHTIYLGENNDVAALTANSGDIQVIGDGGNDTIVGQNFGSETLDGGEDDDVLAIGDGSIGEKTLIGGAGDDVIGILDESGSAGEGLQPNTTIHVEAGAGDDVVGYGGRGLFIGDENDGGAGADTIAFNEATDLHLRDLSIQNFEVVGFSGSDDHVVFADGNNSGAVTVVAGGGDDIIDARAESSDGYALYGQEGNDLLYGGAGDDTLDGAGDDVKDGSADTLDGGDGADVYRIHTPTGTADIVSLEADDTLTFDSEGFGVDAINSPFEGGSQGPIDAWLGDTNLYIITGEGYADVEEVFENFFSDKLLDGDISDVVDHPIFFVYFDNDGDGAGAAQVYFVEETETWDGTGADHVATLGNITSGAQMSDLDASQFGFF